MSNTSTLLQQIDDLVASKTFNLDALDGIKRLKDDLSKTLWDREVLQSKYDGLLKTNAEQSAEIQRQISVIESLKKERDTLREREKKADEAIYTAEKHKAVADTWHSAMAMVFKPNAVRESVQRQVAVPVAGHPGGNGTMASAGWVSTNTVNETVTREDA